MIESATLVRSASPAMCPAVSLTALSPSTSTYATTRSSPLRRCDRSRAGWRRGRPAEHRAGEIVDALRRELCRGSSDRSAARGPRRRARGRARPPRAASLPGAAQAGAAAVTNPAQGVRPIHRYRPGALTESTLEVCVELGGELVARSAAASRSLPSDRDASRPRHEPRRSRRKARSRSRSRALFGRARRLRDIRFILGLASGSRAAACSSSAATDRDRQRAGPARRRSRPDRRPTIEIGSGLIAVRVRLIELGQRLTMRPVLTRRGLDLLVAHDGVDAPGSALLARFVGHSRHPVGTVTSIRAARPLASHADVPSSCDPPAPLTRVPGIRWDFFSIEHARIDLDYAPTRARIDDRGEGDVVVLVHGHPSTAPCGRRSWPGSRATCACWLSTFPATGRARCARVPSRGASWPTPGAPRPPAGRTTECSRSPCRCCPGSSEPAPGATPKLVSRIFSMMMHTARRSGSGRPRTRRATGLRGAAASAAS